MSKLLLIVGLLLAGGSLLGQSPYLVKDIQTDIMPGAMSSNPRGMTAVGNRLYFAASFGFGTQPVVSDGTLAGTKVLPINSSNANPHSFTAVGKQVFFVARTRRIGDALWVTDGTEAGTRLVKDPAAQTGRSSSIAHLTAMGGTLFFAAEDGTHGKELWKSDGTEKGTTMVVDFYKGFSSLSPRGLTVLGNKLIFAGGELMISDGSATGTKVLRAGGKTPVSSPSNFTVVGKQVFFIASDGTHGLELWKSDGTEKGTALVKDMYPGQRSGMNLSSGMARIGNNLVFVAQASTKSQLWISIGTTSGTKVLKDMHASSLVSAGKYVYFVGYTPLTGRELWRTDGTTGGTIRLADSFPGTANGSPVRMRAWGDRLLFAATDSTGLEPWFSDGTAKGTHKLGDLITGAPSSWPVDFTPFGQKVVFTAAHASAGYELHETDGTPSGTKLSLDLLRLPNRTKGSQAIELTDAVTQLLFRATTTKEGPSLWTSNGTAAGTNLFRDVLPKTTFFGPEGLIRVGRHVFFKLLIPGGVELWRTDLTQNGTRMVRRFSYSSASIDLLFDMKVAGDLLLFQVERGSEAGVWCSDGGSNTFRIGPMIHNKSIDCARYRDRIFLTVRNATSTGEVWSTDGTAAGTSRFLDEKSPFSWPPSGYSVAGDTLYFRLRKDGTSNYELYASNGTAKGTRRLGVQNGSHGVWPGSLKPFRGRLLFAASDARSGGELWTTDGTAKGTHMLVDTYPGSGNGGFSFPTEAGGYVWFLAHGPKGRSLWRTDGSKSGTALVHAFTATQATFFNGIEPVGRGVLVRGLDTNSNGSLFGTSGVGTPLRRLTSIVESSDYAWLGPLGSRRAMFRLNWHPKFGTEVWVSDGSVSGTRPIEVVAGPGGGAGDAVLSRGRVYLSGGNLQIGSELFAWDPGATAKNLAGGCGTPLPPRLQVTDPLLGAQVDVRVHSTLATTNGLLFVGGFSARGFSDLGGCLVLPDLTGALSISSFTTGTTGDWQTKIKVPNLAQAKGLELAAQAALGPTKTPPINTDVSNAIYLRLGTR